MTEGVESKARIVVLDGHTLNPGDNPWDGMPRLGEVTVYDRTPAAEVASRAGAADVVVVNKLRLTEADLAALPRLRMIAVSATGYNNVDVAAARARGIVVANVPEYGTDAVAQYAFALLLELCHRVGDHDLSVKRGEWSACPDWSYWNHPLVELAGKRIAIIGFGRIGRRVGEIAHAFGMEVLACDAFRGTDPAYRPFRWCEVAEAFASADVVTLHCPLTNETRRLVNREHLEVMKASAFLVNAARGELVDEAALAEALDSGRLAGAALDVVSEEPIRPENPLLKARNCVLTPHIAWAALGSRQRLLGTTVANVEAFLAGSPRNVVNA